MSILNSIFSERRIRIPRRGYKIDGTCRAHAFTIIEILVVIGVSTVLASLLFGVASSGRQSAQRTQCASTIRQNGLLLSAYAADYKDAIPFAGYRRHLRPIPGGGVARLGGSAGFGQGTWALAFSTEWAAGAWPARWQCPLRPPFTGAELTEHTIPGTDPAAIPFPSYWMSRAMWASWTSDRTAERRVRPVANRLSDVTFPSSKVYLLEAPSYCSRVDPVAQYIGLLPAPKRLVRALFVDGSASDFDRRNPVADGSGWEVVTLHGVRGIDVP